MSQTHPADAVPLSTGKKILLAIVLMVGVPLGLLVLVEGVSSVVLLAADLRPSRQLTERAHTDYDTLLGWVNRRNAHVPDLYGPGIDFRTNSRGFRGTSEVTDSVPPRRVRLICSGDSYTMGWGVRDGDTWCARLAHEHPEIETVNMGQGGYGLDQVYLWYRRDGEQLQHQLHVVAVILHDFDRMVAPTFLGFGKPMLRVDGDSLVVGNVPVPRWSYAVPGLARYLDEERANFAQLRASRLLTRLRRRVAGSPDKVDADSALLPVVSSIVHDLERRNRRKGSRLVLVFLPMPSDLHSARTDRWREWIARVAQPLNIEFVDLVPELRKLPPDSVPDLFIGRKGGGLGHYSRMGNKWVADRLYERLSSLPPLRVPGAR
jgi:hypothetical protein